MPRRKPFTLTLTKDEQRFLDELHRINRQAVDEVASGGPTPTLDKIREDVRDIMQRRHTTSHIPTRPRRSAGSAWRPGPASAGRSVTAAASSRADPLIHARRSWQSIRGDMGDRLHPAEQPGHIANHDQTKIETAGDPRVAGAEEDLSGHR
jgi:hypothetical protein